MKKKVLSIIISFTLIIVSTNIPSEIKEVKAENTINIGQYIQIGKYYDEPILWRCVDIDENGPLMIADRILTIKPFDAPGTHKYLDGTLPADRYYRPQYGSNLWETSNIRSWLNSTDTAGNVNWLDGCPPIESSVSNDYANEKGFLAEGNFSNSEINAIKSVTQKSILNESDADKFKIGGIGTHAWDRNITTSVQNYDTAYYHNVSDKMFLLDVKQINKVFLNSNILGEKYYIGKPTQKAVDNSDYKYWVCSANYYWFNWIRTPYTDAEYPDFVRFINSDGYIDGGSANTYNIGARPAFYLNLSTALFKSGNGVDTTPYIIDTLMETAPTPVELTPTITPTITSSPTTNITPSPTPIFIQPETINLGEYIQMGKFYDEPILWRCIDIDENGPLMMADRILSFKYYDAKGNHKYLDGTTQADSSNGKYRTQYGSNLWETSNIRSWLNSSAIAGEVNWLGGCPPTRGAVFHDPYANDKGFLANDNFTEIERNTIRTVTQKTILFGDDVTKLKDGGTELHIFANEINNVVQNYDTAYYQNVDDKMFLLSVKQINAVYQKTNILGIDYWRGKPTQKAIDNSEIGNAMGTVDTYKSSWLRDPIATGTWSDNVRYISYQNPIYASSANPDYSGNIGVRPAFYLNLSTVYFKSGNGVEGSPYIVYSGVESTPTPTMTPTPTLTLVPPSPTPFPPTPTTYPPSPTTIPPKAPILSANPLTPTNVSVTVTIAYPSDAVIKKFKTENGSWINYTSPFSLYSNEIIYAKCQNDAGAWSDVASITVSNIDTTAPATPQLSINPATVNSDYVRVTIYYPADAVVKKFKTEIGSWLTYTSPFNLYANDTVYAKCQDAAGNWSYIGSTVITNIGVEPPKITISDYTKTPTNQDITVTATTTTGTLNTTSHIFTENGSFTFIASDSFGNYTSETVTIENIDKVSPLISGVSEGGSYTTAIISFNEGTAALNGLPFSNGSIIRTAGNYQLIVTDAAGNSTTINFTINITPYNYSNGNISGIALYTKISEMESNLNISPGETIKIFGTDNSEITQEIKGSIRAATGMYVQFFNGISLVGSKSIVIYGDVSGDGSISIIDMVKMKQHLLKFTQLTGAYCCAGDLTNKGSASISDLLTIKKHLLGIIEISQCPGGLANG